MGAVDRLFSKFSYGSLRRDFRNQYTIAMISLSSTQPGLRRGIFEIETSRHMSPALIFDELEEGPFTENRRWRDSNLKIHTHLQTATDFVGVNAIVRPVCRSGQHALAKRHDNVLNRRAVFCGLLRRYISLPTLRVAGLAGF
jgi:hypothetical protein